MKNTTLKDLSKLLNLSVSTISKALNDSLEISDITKNRVKEAARKTNYRPNPLALSLKKGKSRTIGVVIPSVLDRFSAKLFIGIEKVAYSKGYNAILSTSNYNKEREAHNIDILIEKGVDGVIVSLTDDTLTLGDYSHIERARNRGISVVLANKVPEDLGINKVSIDFYKEACNAVKNLEIRHKNSVIVVDSFSNEMYLDKRKKGIVDALETHHGITDFKIMKSNGEESFASEVVAEAKKALNTTLIVMNQYLLETILVYKDTRKLLDKEALFIYGFSNRKSTFEAMKGVKPISQRGKFLGEKSAELLIEQLENYKEGVHTISLDSIGKKIYE
ncbi:LacI family DNA-binding transcriptional regulator [uncultured Maribacter sp.]|uniref:LacI family DNA-binding transcriptional regulator n=1 Tax=uncultured Maribacter sp. TaxID=431308 RepID=UPI002604B705|nr:LacI family DNA-binding transcriptional regulator [uncultured Maribacter sp.]